MERILTNDFSWSKSRHEKFHECLRAYYLHYYHSWGGWEPDAPDEARRLYVLKKLSNRYSWAGRVVHEAIRDSLIGTRFGRTIDPARMIEKAHRLMQRDYLYSLRKRYWTEPYRRHFRGLVEHEYGEPISRDDWRQNWENARAALSWFFQSRWMSVARALKPEQWLEVDSASFEDSSFVLDGVKVFAIPDFAYLDSDGAVMVVDWKTGKARAGHDDQVLGYALYVASRYQVPAQTVRTSLVYLNEGIEELVRIDGQVLMDFQDRFQRSVASMRSLLLDWAGNAPRPESAFPMTADLALCARCAFRRACGREGAMINAAA